MEGQEAAVGGSKSGGERTGDPDLVIGCFCLFGLQPLDLK